MNVVDSSAWLSFFAGDGSSGKFSKPIEDTENLIVPSITITEVFKCIFRQVGEDMALECIAHMEQGKVIPLDSTLAIEAAHFGLQLKLPLVDSIIYATAQKYRATVWTQDCDLESLDGVKYFAKNST